MFEVLIAANFGQVLVCSLTEKLSLLTSLGTLKRINHEKHEKTRKRENL